MGSKKRAPVPPHARGPHSEEGRIVKKWRGQVKVALCYPNSYYVGMSNLGVHAIYRVLNDLDDCVCERVFLPQNRPFGKGGSKNEIRSEESGRPLKDFNVVAFSISFENDYLNVLSMLESSGIGLWADKRPDGAPLVIAGGAAVTINPEPLASFMDAIVVGDGEEASVELIDAIAQMGRPPISRSRLLDELLNIQGVYVPSRYSVEYHDDGTIKNYTPLSSSAPFPVKRRILKELGSAQARTAVFSSQTEFGDMFLVEIARGCRYKCSFCVTGCGLGPWRNVDFEALKDVLADGVKHRRRVGLVSPALADYPQVHELLDYIFSLQGEFSPSSLRLDAMDDRLAQALKKAGLKTVTLAPEAGTDRLRRLVNKQIDTETIFQTVETLVAHDVLNLKLYFMVGLPTETEADVRAIAEMARGVKHNIIKIVRQKGRLGQITLSVNCFVPKPATPLQWVPMESEKRLQEKLKILKSSLKGEPNIKVTHDIPKWAHLQGLLARGDRRVAGLLELIHSSRGNLKQAIARSQFNPLFYTERPRSRDEKFPWEIVDHGVSRATLYKGYLRAMGDFIPANDS